jgi:hypothetical protein
MPMIERGVADRDIGVEYTQLAVLEDRSVMRFLLNRNLS